MVFIKIVQVIVARKRGVRINNPYSSLLLLFFFCKGGQGFQVQIGELDCPALFFIFLLNLILSLFKRSMTMPNKR